jgi:predicted ATPase
MRVDVEWIRVLLGLEKAGAVGMRPVGIHGALPRCRYDPDSQRGGILAGSNLTFAELKRRRVFGALLGWGVISFAVLQVVEPVMHALELHDWTLKVVVALLAFGFPITAMLSWAYDLTFQGITRTQDSAGAREDSAALARSPTATFQAPPGTGTKAVGTELPRSTTPLVGRESEVRAVAAALASSPLVTITGLGGTGKTRVAIAVAEGLRGKLARRVAFVDLAAITDPALVPRAVASALRLRDLPIDLAVTDAIVSALREESVLVVVDNCEHVVEACAAFAAAVLAGCPGVRLVATSQLPLGIMGEVIYSLAPLRAPPENAVPPTAGLGAWRAQYPALELLVQRFQLVDPGFELTPSLTPHAAEICRRLDGLPLALELVAPRVRVLSLKEIAAQLEQRFQLLSRGDRNAPARHQGLTAVLEWSYALLSPVERRVLERLAVFAGTFAQPAAGAVCAPLAEESGAMLDLLQALVEKSFVMVQRAGDDGPRFRLLETVRQYALLRLTAGGDEQDARSRMLAWAIALVEGDGRPTRQWNHRVATDYDNLRVAFEYSQGRAESAVDGLRLAAGLWLYWFGRGDSVEYVSWLDRALCSAPHAPARLRAEALVGAVVSRHHMADAAGVRGSAEPALRLALDLGDERQASLARFGLAWAEIYDGRPDLGMAFAEQALASARRSEIHWVVAMSLQARSACALLRGDRALAQGSMREAFALMDEASPPILRMYLQFNLGLQAYVNAEHAEARRAWRAGLEDALQFSVRRGAAGSCEGAAYLEAARGAWVEAARLLGAAARIRAETRSPLLPHWVEAHAAEEARVRSALGADFEGELSTGAALSFEEVTARARSVLA